MIGWIRKALTAMRHSSRSPLLLGTLARTKFDYAKEVGSGIDSSVVTAPVQWVQRAFPEARLRVVRETDSGTEEVARHPLVELVERPNPFYGAQALYSATVFSYCVAGNSYWLKVRSGAGRPVELWYVPHWTMSPAFPADGSAFISAYEYRPGGGTVVRLDVDDVVHFRHGIDPRNTRLGLSPLHGVIREIFMDLEASNFVASLLKNMGVPGVVISPEGGTQPTPEDVEAVKAWFRAAFGGDRRGDPLVMGAPTKVDEFGFDPQKLDLSSSRDVAEERVCACLGVPAAVVGFGAGLQTAKVGATMKELIALAWKNGVIPLQSAIADELDRSLLPDFAAGGADAACEFDAGDIVALEDELLARAQRWNTMVAGGWAEVAEAREAMGLPVDDSHHIFLRPFSLIETPAGAPVRALPPPESAGGAGSKQRRATRTLAQNQFVLALERLERPLGRAVAARLGGFFDDLGAAAAAAARPLLEAAMQEQASAPVAETKQSGEDEVLAGRILEAMGVAAHQTAFQRLYEAHYLEVAKEVSKASELIGLATDLPDPVARSVIAAGGRRAGLVDLGAQSRRALFEALAEGRAAGEGVGQLTKRIREHVTAGPWASAEARAETIARTETKHAQRVSTIERARHEGIERFVLFDGRFGEPRSSAEHVARDGRIVTRDEAENIAATTYPNCTLSFSPYFGEE